MQQVVELPDPTEKPTGEGWEGCLGSWTVGDTSVSAWRSDGEEFIVHGPDGYEESVTDVRAYAAALLAACAAIES
jgi:hypothetical protein